MRWISASATTLLFIICSSSRRGATSSLALVQSQSPTRRRQQQEQQHDRRSFLSKNMIVSSSYTAAAIATIVGNNPVAAAVLTEEPTVTSYDSRGDRPFAPLQSLLPATRLKLWVDEVYVLSLTLKSTVQDTNERYEMIQQINEKLSHPPKLFQGEKMGKQQTIISSSTAQLTTGISSASKNQYQLNRKGFNLGDKMTAMMNQADVERQWGMLQYAESKREENNEMRAVFNFYARQLTYADDYKLTASPEEKKQMIRSNDGLPTLTAVIASDLDRRDLYRNQFLTSMDDAIAEAAYQFKKQNNNAAITEMMDDDATDLVDLISQAHSACEDWFSLIAPQDIEEAIQEVQKMVK